MTIEDWWKQARTLAIDLANAGNKPAEKQLAKRYTTLRSVILKDTHHIPEGIYANKLLADLNEWITAVKAGTYNKRFSPKPTGAYNPK